MQFFFSEHFKWQLKKLKKKFPHVKENLLEKLESINLHNEIPIGHGIYKIRIKSSDMTKGKSGEFRTYIYLYFKKDLLVPLCMYVKANQESITENALKYHFDKTLEELLNSFM